MLALRAASTKQCFEHVFRTFSHALCMRQRYTTLYIWRIVCIWDECEPPLMPPQTVPYTIQRHKQPTCARALCMGPPIHQRYPLNLLRDWRNLDGIMRTRAHLAWQLFHTYTAHTSYHDNRFCASSRFICVCFIELYCLTLSVAVFVRPTRRPRHWILRERVYYIYSIPTSIDWFRISGTRIPPTSHTTYFADHQDDSVANGITLHTQLAAQLMNEWCADLRT